MGAAALSFAVGTVLGSIAAHADAPQADATEAASTIVESGIAYTFGVQGVTDGRLRERLEQSANLYSLRDKPPLSVAALRRRAASDVERLDAVLRAEGFYAAAIDVAIDDSRRPVPIVFTIDTGTVYVLADYEIAFTQAVPPEALSLAQDLETLGLEIGMRARSADVVQAQSVLIDRLTDMGHPFARVTDREAVVDHDRTTMSVLVTVDPGPAVRYGPMTISGLENVRERYVRRFVPWREGDVYRRSEVIDFRRRLLATNLFASVRAEPETEPEQSGPVPIEVAVIESKHRSIGVGARFSSSEGFEGEVFWRHRNLFGAQEQLTLTATAGQILQSLRGEFLKPNFRRLDQSFRADSEIRREDNDAYQEYSISAFGGIDRAIDDRWTAGGGLSLEFSEIEDGDGTRKFTIVGVPLTARYEGANSILEPTRGARAQLRLTPSLATLDETSLFTTAEATGAVYYAFDEAERIVAAARGRFGSIVGASTQTLPANRRFYAGGGGSVRGYDFRSLGPLDASRDPRGGRSVLEANFELRFRVTETIGIVPFIDGGQVFDSSLPDFEEQPLWAAGIGFRYFTPIGPVRFDIAFPLNGRDNVDDSFQFYISLGQAF